MEYTEEAIDSFMYRLCCNHGISTRSWFKYGSRFTCKPPVLTTDSDVCLKLGTTNKDALITYLGKEGFTFCNEYMGRFSDDWFAMRKGNFNLIVAIEDWIFEANLLGTFICTRLNLLEKEDRRLVFKALRKEVEPYISFTDNTVI